MATWKILLCLEDIKKLPSFKALSSDETQKLLCEMEDTVWDKEANEIAEQLENGFKEDPATTVARENGEACIDRE